MAETWEKIEKEKKLREDFDKLSPEEKFEVLSELYKQGIDPKEIGLVPGNPVTKKVPSADKMASKLVKRVSVAGDDWLSGIQNPSRNPIEAALAAKDKWVDRLTTAIKEGRWEGGLKKTSLDEIIRTAQKLGPRVFTEGVSAREDKIKKVFTELQPLFQSVSDAVQSMPDKTDADREKRLLTARRLMIEVGKKRRGGA